MRIALPATLRNRGGNTQKDARSKNCVVEVKGGNVKLLKRPALDQAFESLTGNGQLITTRNNDDLIVVTDDVLTVGLTATTRSLSFSIQPDESDINVAIAPSVVVHALNSFGQVVSGYTQNVTIEIANNPTGATLSGTLTVAAAAGVATFSNLKLDHSGEGFTLRATDATGLRRPVSSPFDIPTRLVFTAQPQGTDPDTTMAAVEVTVQDPGGNTDTNYDGDVSLELFGTVGGVLSGTTTKAAVNGVATFNDLRVNLAGTYDLKATAAEVDDCYPPSSQFSASFSIGVWTLTSVNLVAISPDANGFVSGIDGSISPTTLNGQTISGLYSQTNFIGSDTFNTMSVVGLVAQDFFTSVTVGAVTLTTATAAYSQLGGETIWSWTVASTLIPAAGPFSVQFV